VIHYALDSAANQTQRIWKVCSCTWRASGTIQTMASIGIPLIPITS